MTTSTRSVTAVAGLVLGIAMLVRSERAYGAAQNDSDGWTIPKNAAAEHNPIALTPAVAAKGQALYKSKCQRCHGASGKGNGPDAEPDHSPGDLTDATRATRNPDGIIFYKVWNGRSKPKMPAFKSDISRDDVWTIIHYVKTFRASS